MKKRHIASAARVCRTWKEPALDELWSKLSSPFPLLELLGPLAYEDQGWTSIEFSGWVGQTKLGSMVLLREASPMSGYLRSGSEKRQRFSHQSRNRDISPFIV
ncbi:hypothetical protein M407DRAFT_34932 [Tulasnella calospora MUT 4182]|uniref:F-box domain-containing protein n=1 Tax=Tulasnella calospora MUT 4182 TaxID=1051891 RepID=A0A0C3PZU7_9AGAM|nr:hypothetical protein M407DRAFT_34932 [Tulasnella calospora MUT 4182]